jgi:isoleucyl-tRNA synthetase
VATTTNALFKITFPKDEFVDYKNSLNLPQTTFSIRPQSKVDDPALIERWQNQDIYNKATKLNDGKKKYILHVGPPYANGHIHLGHAYNVILKDIVTKSYRMAGYHVPVKPGWDCHGLPIELKVTQQDNTLKGAELKKACRAYATQWVNIQRTEFRQLGAIMDWENPYITMDYNYEAAIVQAFIELVDKGCIERKNKTVTWCSSCQTTLATAEIEYQDRKDPSLYIAFAFDNSTITHLFDTANIDAQEQVYAAIWTTTPWTVPLNRGVLAHPKATYSVVRCEGKIVIIATARLADFEKVINKPCEVISEIVGSTLAGARLQHPFDASKTVPLIFDEEAVSLSDGTAFVHCAPGCGPIDYEIGIKNNLEIFSPLTPTGSYSTDIIPKELAGMSIQDGQIWVIKALAGQGMLLAKTSIKHSYPHCWRCHQGLMFRATPQWFFDLQKHQIQSRSLDAINAMAFNPSSGKFSLKATVENRWEWCLSRQRSWGVPIPALICKSCNNAYITHDLGMKAVAGIKEHGVEYWDIVSPQELMGDIACPHCGSNEWTKETNILDVWFESGLSHYAVLANNPQLSFPADLYLEGIDQYRGWFQSSLLTSIALHGIAPMNTIMSHGFTVDGKGQKMSKSLGNVVAPQEIIDKIGTDGLRLWVASIGNDGDALISDTVVNNVSEVYRKIRNTMRFLLQNTFDYDHSKDAVSVADLTVMDRYALYALTQFSTSMYEAYARYDTTAVFHGLAQYCSTNLSSLYLDVVKDRLYVEDASGLKRRSAQTVLWYILDTLTRIAAPIMSFTAELVADQYQGAEHTSIHLQEFRTFENTCIDCTQVCNYTFIDTILLDIRSALLRSIELLRETGSVKHSLEVEIRIYVDQSYQQYEGWTQFIEFLKTNNVSVEDFLREFLIVSDAKVITTKEESMQETGLKGIYCSAQHAAGVKCPRCWWWTTTQAEDGLCERCAAIIAK